MIEPGSSISIRNSAGILSVDVCEKLDMRNVTQGIGSDKLPAIQKPRLEFHRCSDGTTLITLCNRQYEVPCEMFLFILGDDGVEGYRGEYQEDEREDRAFVTIEA